MNTPSDQNPIEPGVEPSIQHEQKLRRALLKAGMGVSAVLASQQAHSTLSKGYSCTISGKSSGNTSHRDYGSTGCQVGHPPSKWCEYTTYPWPSSCKSPIIKKASGTKGGYKTYSSSAHNCGYRPSKSEFNGGTYCIHPTGRSNDGTADCRSGATFEEVIGTSQGCYNLVGLTELKGTTGRKASAWEVMNYPDSYGTFAQCIAAAMLNAKKYPNTYPCPESQIRDIWVSIQTSGGYTPVPGGPSWGALEVIEYFNSTWA
ncbi:hypothetical protein [Methyloversatilis thermotolerans]|uniref:hypothetical protein n=1 Tax=Methyloversatilis thermotolerans TaxID=1346290 RepID=UPI000381FC36|nr:hypothetical protein [Methyloversatilis thermotolerans]